VPRLFKCSRAGLLALFCVVPLSNVASIAVHAQALIPHRAVYDVSLAKMSENEGVRGARGTMVYVITDRCEGYTMETTMEIDMAFTSGVYNMIDQRFASWEAKNGRESTFRMEIIENGKMGRSHRGRIDLAEDGSGKIVIESDGIASFDLPPGTQLSTSHMLSILENARAGKRFLSSPVIDGSFENGPYQVTAVIGASQPEPAEISRRGLHEIGRGPHWPIGMAYFPYASTDVLPEIEVAVDLMQGGIAQTMTQQFGDYSLGFELVYVEPLQTTCGD
jgi:hypothetical protein